MTYRQARIRRRRLVAALVAGAALAAALGDPLPSSPQPVEVVRHERPKPDPLGEAGGALPDGASIFDDALPGIANLDGGLLDALRRAASDAGVEFVVNSGWRSPEYQQRLFDEAVAEHGSEEEAARWAAPATSSAHVSGDAVDIGPTVATDWLAQHGAEYGLCQIYANEPWHYELRPGGCPEMYADATQDPRLFRR